MRFSVKSRLLCAALPLAMLAACSDNSADYSTEEALEASADFEGAAMQAEAVADAAAEASGSTPSLPSFGELEVNLPKLAYSYNFAWRLPGADIPKLQRRHADLCEQQGPASCQIVGMSRNGEFDDDVTGQLQLAVATRHARAFGALLEDTTVEAGAEQVSANITADELSKNIVDTEAQITARTELRDRLREVLRTRKGTVQELVEAERSVARVNQEIDQARSWLKEMEGRVAYSRVTVDYRSGVAVTNDFLAPIQGVLNSLGSILGFIVAGLILGLAILGPIFGIVWAGRKINRRISTPEPSEG